MSDVILAVKAVWCEKILTGEKTVEVRRVLPVKLRVGDKVYLYCGGAIWGYAECLWVEMVDEADEYELWPLAEVYADRACLEEEAMVEYMLGGRRAGVILLGRVERYAKPEVYKGASPQNFVYADGGHEPCRGEVCEGKKFEQTEMVL